MCLRIYVAGYGDTLRSIASKHETDVHALLALNSRITDPDQWIDGTHVRLPARANAPRRQLPLPLCPVPDTEYPEHWIPLTSLEDMAQTEYDVLIVGTGAGGGAAVWRLSEQWGENEKRIGVVEAGDLVLPTHGQNIPTFNTARFEQFWHNPLFLKKIPIAGSFSGPEASLVDGYFSEFIALGGQSLIWATTSPRMDDSVLLHFPVPAQEMARYYDIAEQTMSVNAMYARESQLQDILLHRLEKQGFPDAADLPMAVDLNRSDYGLVHSNVFFSSLHFLAMAMNRRQIDLAVNARAVRVEVEKERAVGVQVMSADKQLHLIKAKTVILAAGTFETPRILLSSDIEGRAIGHYLVHHSMLSAAGTVSRKEFPENLGVAGILIPSANSRPYQIKIQGPGSYFWYQFKEVPLREHWDIYLHATGQVQPRYENRVMLDRSKTDEFGLPGLLVQFSYSREDTAVILQMSQGIQYAASAMKTAVTVNGGKLPYGFPGQEFHSMGTCRMGFDPDTSGTDPYGRVHGVSGLYVADNSILPASGGTSPTLTTVALAIRTADDIVEKMD
ncbi:GMC family oxidoreductase N-terminal domain-containing protein [Paenibacillus sp. N4]|uniref:GMC oxidoreductase n=1 Tax=Paenibacillus vietnamensis TaxID=2590547 RepID=UPI001CD081AD|nr:GMC oxidoreductase [Paenibacillus vietnamensis]MCA0757202.1 GMC family oxidoreductase N-terminal domain-containing protein [Paenibacillus vietnamensis]